MNDLNINELNGFALKKSLGAKRVIKSYQNKHVGGSGNFGFVIRYQTNELGSYNGEKWFTLSGYYDQRSEVKLLQYAPYISAGVSLMPQDFQTYETLVAFLQAQRPALMMDEQATSEN